MSLRTLGKKLKDLFQDDKGFFQRGRITAQPLQRIVQQATRPNPRAYHVGSSNFNPLHPQGNLFNFGTSAPVIPQIRPFGSSLGGEIGNFAANIPGAFINPVANLTADLGQLGKRTLLRQSAPQYNQVKSPFSRLAMQAAVSRRPQAAKNLKVPTNATQVIGNIGGVGADMLTYVLPKGTGKVLNAAKNQAGKGFLKIVGKQAVTGGKYGGAFGILSGLSEGRGENPAEQLKKALTYGAGGAIAGGALGGTIGAGGYVWGAIRNAIKQVNPKLPEQQIRKATEKFIRDEAGRFAGIKKKQPEFIKDPYLTESQIRATRRSLGLPERYDVGAIDLSAKVGIKSKLPKGGAAKMSKEQVARVGDETVANRLGLNADTVTNWRKQHNIDFKTIARNNPDDTVNAILNNRPLSKELPKQLEGLVVEVLKIRNRPCFFS